MTYILAFNGPPGCGKDTLGKAVADYLDTHGDNSLPVATFEIKARLMAMGMAVLGFPANAAIYNGIKDNPQDAFNGKSLREWMIDVTEKHLKLVYGKTFWANQMIHTSTMLALQTPGLAIVTDFGFNEEFWLFQKTFGIDNVITLRPIRLGFTDWKNDSRSYVDDPCSVRINNDRHPAVTAGVIVDILRNRGWLI